MAGLFSNHLNRLSRLIDSESHPSVFRLRRQVRHAPEDVQAWCRLCRALYVQGQRDEARQRLQEFLGRTGDTHLEAMGLLALDLGDLDTAEECFRRQAALQPAAAGPASWLGIVHAQRGDDEAARRALRQATELEPGQAEAWYRLGSFLLRKRELDEAEEHLRHALALDPALGRAHTNLGYLLDLRGDRQAALRSFHRAVQLSPGDPEGHFNLGALHAEAHSFDLAREHFLEGLRLAPDSVEGHYNLGAVQFEQRRYDEAIRSFRRALRLQPAHEEARYYLGLCFVRKGAYDRALQQFELAGRDDRPPTARLLYAMALCHNGLEMPRQAARLLQQVIDLVPDHAKAHHLLGVCFDKLGERERAAEAYRRADVYLTLARARRGAARLERISKTTAW